MSLIDNWKAVVSKSWSFRLMIASAALGAAELSLPLFNGVFPQKLFATASMLVGIAAAVARVVYQASMHDEKPD
jgi:hypothetical protein